MLKSRKAQITVFLIVGIIMLFSSALIFYIRGQVTDSLSGQIIPETQEVPLEAQPIKLYVENCILRTATDALYALGRHGGYIDPSDTKLSGTEFMIGMEPTESDGIFLNDPKDLIPYWWYLSSSNNCRGTCKLDSLMPPLHKASGTTAIEAQMDRYVNRELEKCLAEFKNFEQQGMKINVLGNVSSDVRITEKDISIIVKYPIELVKEGRSTEINKYFTRVPLKFKEIYDMAVDIAEQEMNDSYLETHTMNMISMKSKPLSSKKLPPIAEATVNPNEFIYWTTTETKNKMEQYVIPQGIEMLQIDQSRDFERVIMFEKNKETGKLEYDRMSTGIMDKTVIRLPKNYTNILARFTYLDWWPIYLTINDKEILMAQKVDIPIISWIAGNNYRFYYSTSYPVLVTLDNPDAFQGDGYVFMFSLEANLRDNEPVNVSTYQTHPEEQGTLVCSPNQQQGGESTIEVVNSMTGKAVEGVRISTAFGSEGCFIGVTKKDYITNKTIINASLPVGLGELRAVHPDYLEYSEQILIQKNNPRNITIKLMPFKFINTSFMIRPLGFDTASRKYRLPPMMPHAPMNKNEKALIMLTRIDDDEFVDFKTSVFVDGQGTGMLRLIPGTYEAKATLIVNRTDNPIRVGPDVMEINGGIFGKDETVKLNQTLLETWMIGGLVFNNETGYFKVTTEELFGNEKLVFYLLRFPPPETHAVSFANKASLEQAGQHEEYSAKYRTALNPQWY